MTQLALFTSATVTPTSLTLKRGLTDKDYFEIGYKLAACETGVQWWIGDWLNSGRKGYGELKERCEAVEIEYASGKQYAYVSERVERSIRIDRLKFGHHQVVAAVSPTQQKKWLAKALAGGWTVGRLRAEIGRARLAAVEPLKGKYSLVYADPPWSYGDDGLDDYGHAERHYTCMSIDELAELPIAKHITADAVLFLWVTSPLLAECWPIITAWGFEYKTSFVWDKVKHNHGHYNSVRHELLLVATAGRCTPEVGKLFDSVIVEERSEHSVKPQVFREIIETLYPSARKVELFSRAKFKGWTGWGAQAP